MFGFARKSMNRVTRVRGRLGFECLEDRSVPAAISGIAFYDANANGAFDTGECYAAGLAVALNPLMGSSASTTTDGSGYYEFTGLSAGSYTVQFTPPSGYAVATPLGGSGSVSLGTSDETLNAGLVSNGGGGGSGVPTISLMPTNTSEGGTGGVSFMRMGGDLSQPLTLTYDVGGSAEPGTGNDYAALSGTVTFAANSSTVVVDVVAFTDTLAEPNESVSLMLTTGSGYTLSGGATTATAVVTIMDVAPPNHDPILSAVPDQYVVPGEPVSFQLSATDPDDDPLTYSAVGLPLGLVLDAVTGVVSGSLSEPGPADPDVFNVIFTVQDNRGGNAAQPAAVLIPQLGPIAPRTSD